jgi:hypothetical protein
MAKRPLSVNASNGKALPIAELLSIEAQKRAHGLAEAITSAQ